MPQEMGRGVVSVQVWAGVSAQHHILHTVAQRSGMARADSSREDGDPASQWQKCQRITAVFNSAQTSNQSLAELAVEMQLAVKSMGALLFVLLAGVSSNPGFTICLLIV